MESYDQFKTYVPQTVKHRTIRPPLSYDTDKPKTDEFFDGSDSETQLQPRRIIKAEKGNTLKPVRPKSAVKKSLTKSQFKYNLHNREKLSLKKTMTQKKQESDYESSGIEFHNEIQSP